MFVPGWPETVGDVTTNQMATLTDKVRDITDDGGNKQIPCLESCMWMTVERSLLIIGSLTAFGPLRGVVGNRTFNTIQSLKEDVSAF